MAALGSLAHRQTTTSDKMPSLLTTGLLRTSANIRRPNINVINIFIVLNLCQQTDTEALETGTNEKAKVTKQTMLS